MNPFAAWVNFYVIVGSAAGALVGLQFVAIALVANKPLTRTDSQAGQAFSTPTVVHFATVLLLSASVTAPWHGIIRNGVAIIPGVFLIGLAGLLGVLYTASVVRLLRRQAVYVLEFEDWIFHALLPFAAYSVLVVAAVVACVLWQQFFTAALFVMAAAVLLLLVIGMHNAWDLVTYHVFSMRETQDKAETAQKSSGTE
jgi:hypothetical protein